MQMVKENSSIRDITRGGQLYMHSFRMFMQVLKVAVMCSLIIFASMFIGIASKKTTEYERYILGQYIEAQLKLMLNEEAYNIIQNPKGSHPPVVQIYSTKVVKMPSIIYYTNRCLEGFLISFKWSAGISLLALSIILGFLLYKGRQHHIHTQLKGQDRVSQEDLIQRLKAKKENSEFNIAGVPLVKGSETQHILLVGTTGTGKSVCMQELMDQVRKKKERAIVYDIDGVFVPTYFRPEKDIILNPLDERCPKWNIWQEARDASDFDSAALSLMPLHLAGTDPFWIHASHTIFTSACLKLKSQNKTQNRFLLEPIFSSDLDNLADLVTLTPAETLISDKIDKTALSIKATLSNYCRSLMYLKDDLKGPLFSIRRWVEADEEDSWLFIASNAQKIDSLRPLLSVWLDIAAKSTLSLNAVDNRHLWFFMDEFTSLHKLPSIVNVLSRGRKYGVCFASAIQDIHQAYSIYGHHDAETLMSLFNTKVFFRTNNPTSAQWMSKAMTEKEFLEKKEGFSYGAHEMRDGVSIHEERRKEPIVWGSEFLKLDDLQAFLGLPGDWPVAKIKFKIKSRKKLQEAFIERDLSNVLLLDKTFPKNNGKNEADKQDIVVSETNNLSEGKTTVMIKGSQKLKQAVHTEPERNA